MKNKLTIFSVLFVLAMLGIANAALIAPTGSAIAPQPSAGPSCTLSAYPSSINVNTKSAISITCSLPDGSACSGITWAVTTKLGSVSGSDSGASFTSASAGVGTVTASGSYSNSLSASPVATPFSCSTSITVAAAPTLTATACSISPNPINAGTQVEVPLSVTCSASDGSIVSCPTLSVITTIGSITSMGGNSFALNSGTVGGAGTIRASFSSVAVQAAGTKTAIGADLTGTGVLIAAALTSTGTGSALPATGVSCFATVNVQQGATSIPTTVVVSPSSSALSLGAAQQFTATVYDQYGAQMPNAAFTWAVEAYANPSPTPVISGTASAAVTQPVTTSYCGTVSTAGVFTATKEGTCQLKATFTGFVVPAKVNASIAATASALTAGTAALPAPGVQPLVGYAVITVTTSPTPVPTTVVVSPSVSKAYIGGTQQFTASVYDQFGAQMSNALFTWSVVAATAPTPAPVPIPTPVAALSSGTGTISTLPATTPYCGTVSSAGIFTATKVGACDVKASFAGFVVPAKPVVAATASALGSGTPAATAAALPTAQAIYGLATVNVIATTTGVPTTMTIEPGSVVLNAGGAQTFTAHVYDQNGVEMMGQTITWSVTSPTPLPTPGPAPVPAPVASALSTGTGGNILPLPLLPCGTITPNPDSANQADFTAKLEGVTCSVVAKVSTSSIGPVPVPAPVASALNTIGITTTGYIQATASVTVLSTSSNQVPTSITVVPYAPAAIEPTPIGPASDRPNIGVNRHKVKQHGTQAFVAHVYDQNGVEMFGVPVTWLVVSDDQTAPIGKVDASGMFYSNYLGGGSVVARVYFNSPAASAASKTLTANALSTAVAASPIAQYIEGAAQVQVVTETTTIACSIIANTDSGLVVGVNTKTTLSASCSRAGAEVVCPALSWISSIGTFEPSPSIIGSATFVSGSVAGQGTIRSGGFDPDAQASFSCFLPVTISAGTPASVTVTPASATVTVNGQQKFTAIIRDEFGNELQNIKVAWTIQTLSLGTPSAAATTQIGSIDSSGVFTARLTGTGLAIVTVASPDGTALVAQAKIQVVPATSGTTICQLTPSSVQLAAGQAQTFSVACMSADGSSDVVCPPMGWSTTAPGGVITPNPDAVGMADFVSKTTGTGAVTATEIAISVAQDPITCSAKVAVGSGSGGRPAGINIIPTTVSLSVGQSQKFVTEVYDDAGNLLDPNAQDTWYLQWTVETPDGTVIGKVDNAGYFVATSAGVGTVKVEVIGPWMNAQTVSASAKVSVSATQTGTYCRPIPSDLKIAANADPAPFEVHCYDSSTPSASILGTEVMCPTMDWSASIGKIVPNSPGISVVQTAAFSPGSVAGTGTVTAVGTLTTAAVATSLISCAAPVAVTGGVLYSMQLAPSSASLYIGDTQAFSAYGYDINGNNLGQVSSVDWTVEGTVGTISAGGLFTATTEGTGTVVGNYNAPSITQVIMAKAPVTVSKQSPSPGPSPGPGGNGGGSNSGGGSFASATTMSYTCAGQPGSLNVRILLPGASLLAEIFSVGNNGGTAVYSQTTSSDTTMPFTVPAAGDYELRVSVDKNQRSVSFTMPPCTPTTKNETKEVSIQVKEPEKAPVPVQPKPVTKVTEVVPPAPQASGIPAWALLVGAVLLLAAAYFLIFGKKKAAS